jgi:AcrR family transcriptional regulator
MPVAKQKSASVSHLRRAEVRDQRVRRTRARIDAAFLALLQRRPYGDLRISDICKKAAVGRATFYAHYATKDELLRSQFERRVAPMLAIRQHSRHLIDATTFFTHVRDMPGIFSALMGPRGGTAPFVLRECFESRVRQALEADGVPGTRKTPLPRFMAATLLTLIEFWLEGGTAESPMQMQALFSSLVHPAVKSSSMPAMGVR